MPELELVHEAVGMSPPVFRVKRRPETPNERSPARIRERQEWPDRPTPTYDLARAGLGTLTERVQGLLRLAWQNGSADEARALEAAVDDLAAVRRLLRVAELAKDGKIP